MIFRYKEKVYNLILWKKIFPIGITEIVSSLRGEPTSHQLVVNGNKLSGKVALVTGAYKGIGYHIALRLLKEGAKVIITGRNVEELNRTVNFVNSPSLKSVVWDISDGHYSEHFDEVGKLFGTIDILINNAGVTSNTKTRPSFEEMDRVHWHYVHDINTIATSVMCKIFTKKYNEGTILNIISNTAVLPAQDSYFTSKWALYSFTKAFSDDLTRTNSKVTVNGLCPGPIKTDMTVGKYTTMYRREIPNHRIGLPEEIAELAFVQILSGLSGQNGEITVCDGGQIYRL